MWVRTQPGRCHETVTYVLGPQKWIPFPEAGGRGQGLSGVGWPIGQQEAKCLVRAQMFTNVGAEQ